MNKIIDGLKDIAAGRAKITIQCAAVPCPMQGHLITVPKETCPKCRAIVYRSYADYCND